MPTLGRSYHNLKNTLETYAHFERGAIQVVEYAAGYLAAGLHILSLTAFYLKHREAAAKLVATYARATYAAEENLFPAMGKSPQHGTGYVRARLVRSKGGPEGLKSSGRELISGALRI